MLSLAVVHLATFAHTQFRDADWIPAKVEMKDGEILHTNTIINNQFFEGTLITKTDERIITVSPQKLESFTLYPKDSDSLYFVSTKTSFLKSNGIKASFLNEYYKGRNFSLYKKKLPDKNWIPLATPYTIGYVQYLQNEVTLFISNKEIAYQVSKPSGINYEKGKYKIERTPFFDAFGEQGTLVRKFVKKNKLNINRIEHILQILKYANTL